MESRVEPRLELGVHLLCDYVELFWNSLDNAPSSIVFYLEMKVVVEVDMYTILGRSSPLGRNRTMLWFNWVTRNTPLLQVFFFGFLKKLIDGIILV